MAPKRKKRGAPASAPAAEDSKRPRTEEESDALANAERLWEEQGDGASAAAAAEEALTAMGDAEKLLGDLARHARALVLKGKVQLKPLLKAVDAGRRAPRAAFRAPWRQFQLALRLDPECTAAKEELERIRPIIEPENEEVVPPKKSSHNLAHDVIIVGAGACGVGVGLMLTKVFAVNKVLLLERGQVGETFRQWPKEMRFISPSFNQQGWTNSFDLNSIAYGTSPAFLMHSEHPSGEEYARYLSALAKENDLKVKGGSDVLAVRPFADGKGFDVDIKKGSKKETLQSRYVVWAAGEFQYPKAGAGIFPGSEHCLHNSTVRSWKELPGDDFIVIGGYESGIDAASNLSLCGKRCSVLASSPCWRVRDSDPSLELAPYTAGRLKAAQDSATPPRLLAPYRVFAVEQKEGGGFLVRARRLPSEAKKPGQLRPPLPGEEPPEEEELQLSTPQKPLLCAGFEGSVRLGAAKELFDWGEVKAAAKGKGEESREHGPGEGGEEESAVEPSDEEEGEEGKAEQGKAEQGKEEEGKEEEGKGGGCADTSPLLNEVDESTKTPGLFLVGPSVRHEGMSFCFVYKFRQRFGIVADAIARGLGFKTKKGVEDARKQSMFLDDFECCKDTCNC